MCRVLHAFSVSVAVTSTTFSTGIMNFLLVFVGVVAFAAAQPNWHNNFQDHFNSNNKFDFTVDVVQNYRFEDHQDQKGHHLIVAISDSPSDKACHVIEVADNWENYLDDKHAVHDMSEEIYQLLTSHTAQETTMSMDELRNMYGDHDALTECYQHRLYLLKYVPSFNVAVATDWHHHDDDD